MNVSKSDSKATVVAALIAAIAAIVVALIHYYPWPNRAMRISGTVVDSESNEGIGQARMILSGRAEAYLTEDNGNFKIEITAKEEDATLLRVRVSRAGYKVYDESVSPPLDRLIIPLQKLASEPMPPARGSAAPADSGTASESNNDAVKRGRAEPPVYRTAKIPLPVDQGQITYRIESCKREGNSSLACYGFVTNGGSTTRRILLISGQRGGIRSTALDGLGKTKAIDEQANEYVASQIFLANQGSPETGQFFYDLRPRLQVPLTIRFANFDAAAGALYSLEIHGSDGTPLNVVFNQIVVGN